MKPNMLFRCEKDACWRFLNLRDRSKTVTFVMADFYPAAFSALPALPQLGLSPACTSSADRYLCGTVTEHVGLVTKYDTGGTVIGPNAGTSQNPVLNTDSHSRRSSLQDGTDQIGRVKTQDRDEGARLSDADFHDELTAVIPHLRAFARMLCGDRDRADDLAQETLMKAWAARASFIAGTRFRAWTYTILRHLYFGQIRRERFVGEYNEAEAERILTMHGSQEGRLDAADVLRALATLPAAQREVLVLMCVGGFGYEEIAEICGTPLGTVKSRIARAHAALSAVIDGGILPDARSDFDLKDDVHDAFFEELLKVAPPHVTAKTVG